MDKDLQLAGMRIAILATNGFEQAELTGPMDALQHAGAETRIISEKHGLIQGFNHVDKADQFEVQLTLGEASPDDFDGVLLPGGVVNADHIRTLPAAQEFVRAIDEASKPIAVICHGAWLLVSAGLVEGRTLTSWPSLRDDLRNAGATWVDKKVELDGNLVSSRKPDDIPAFNEKFVSLLSQRFSRSVQGTADEQPMGLSS